MRKDELSVHNGSAKVLPRPDSFKEIALKAELLIQVPHIQLRIAKLMGKLT